MSREPIELVNGQSGSGKSYTQAVYICEQFLRFEDGHLWTNLPLNVDAVCDWMRNRHGADGSTIRERIHLLPLEVRRSWQLGESGPWEYLAERDIAGDLIVLDEVQNYCGERAHSSVRERWGLWAAELRHQHASLRMISQDPQFICGEVVDRAAIRWDHTQRATIRDPFLGVLIGDWWQLRAKLTGRYAECFSIVERRRDDRRWVETGEVQRVRPDPAAFALYDSYSAPESGSGKAARSKEREWQRLGWKPFLKWFAFRNGAHFAWRLAAAAAIVWFVGGGHAPLMAAGLGWIQSMVKPAAPPSVSAAPGSSSAKGQGPGPPVSPKRREAQSKLADEALRRSVESLREQLDAADVRFEAAAAKLREVQEAAERSVALDAVMPERCVLGGRVYGVGERVEGGKHAGETIEVVDLRRRGVRLGNGQWLSVGSERERARLRRTRDGDGASDERGPAREPVGKAGHDRSRRDALSGVRQDARD